MQETNSRVAFGSQFKNSQNPDNQKTTTGDQEKRYRLIKKLDSHNVQQFRQINIDQFDLNITEQFQELQYVDDTVTPLMYCAHHGLKEICKHLLKNKNIDVDMQTQNNKQTALIVACMTANYEIIRYLLLAGAQVNKPNSINQNPLTVILFRLVDQPYSFQNKKICFMIADFLLKNGADINWIVDKSKGYSLLHYFCASKMKMNKNQILINYQIIKFLLEKGANINQLTLADKTCFDLCKNHCNKQQIYQLLQKHKLQKAQMDKLGQKKLRSKISQDYFKIQIKKE